MATNSRLARIARAYWPFLIIVLIVGIVVGAFPSSAVSSKTVKVNLSLLGTSLSQKPGYTVAGYRCGPKIRQVPWSKYAPYCIPAWHGNNGGATYPGVSRNTITITYRSPNTAGASLLLKIFGSEIGTNAQAIQTMKDYIHIFNHTFELYGRHVVLKPFSGKGDFVNELQGQGLEQAKEDALTAKKLNAFADVSLLSSTQIYDQYLAHEGIIAIGALAQPSWWFQDYAPFEYSPNPSCDTGVEAIAQSVGRSFAGLPAIFSTSPTMKKKTRVFGIIFPESPTYASCGNLLVRLLKQEFNVTVARRIEYSISFSQESSEAQSAIAQMKASGVTTILCGCDPIFPWLLTLDAQSQNYYPEWLALDFEDIFTQIYVQSEWAHAISTGLLLPPETQQEAYKVFYNYYHKAPPSPQFAEIYPALLLLFDGLQAAGPDLNPYTFEQGFFRLPDSLPGGNYGLWVFSKNRFTTPGDFDVLEWNTLATSPQDNKPGTYIACYNGRRFPLSVSGAKELPYHQQPDCPSTPVPKT
jgi:hypothetical protein